MGAGECEQGCYSQGRGLAKSRQRSLWQFGLLIASAAEALTWEEEEAVDMWWAWCPMLSKLAWPYGLYMCSTTALLTVSGRRFLQYWTLLPEAT